MEPLYNTDAKGVTRIWWIDVDGDMITRNWGVDGGKIQMTRRRATGKRLTPHQEAESMWKAQVDKGYLPKNCQAKSFKPPLPMLAQPYKKIQGRWFCQPKLDGVRIVVSPGGVFSRTGKRAANMDHLLEGLEMPEGWWLDGEAYIHNMPFEKITGSLHNASSKTKLAMHVFDVIDADGQMNQEERLEWLKQWNPPNPWFKVVAWEECNITNVQGKHDRYVSEGYEGIILRDPQGAYTRGKRSRGLLKLKKFQDKEYAITGHDRDVDGGVIWICEPGFRVRPRGTREQRATWAQNAQEHVGKMLTVRYQELTDKGIPRFPVGVAIRDYE